MRSILNLYHGGLSATTKGPVVSAKPYSRYFAHINAFLASAPEKSACALHNMFFRLGTELLIPS